MKLGFILNVLEILGILKNLLTGYISSGWPFAGMHALVAGAIILDSWYRKIRVETKALSDWTPEASSNVHGAETTSVLNNFVEETKKLGPQGFLVPITDFSDRVDSLVDGLVSELHDRINLFLLVGVAGTIFGLFEFGFNAYGALTSPTVEDDARIKLLGQYLSLSMSKAFPVGFVGLLLTFIFQIVAAFPERRLRGALSKATREALVKRKELSVSQASAALMSAAAIKEALQPLSDLKLTLEATIRPMLMQFADRLDQSLTLVKSQFEAIQTTTTNLKEAVDSVNTGVNAFNEVAGNLKTLLGDVPAVLGNTIKLQETELATLKNFDEVMGGYMDQVIELNLALNLTLNRLNDFPTDLIRETKPIFDNLATDSITVWRDSSKEFYEIISHDYDGLFDKIDSRIERVESQLVTMSTDLQTVTGNLGTAITALTDLPSHIDSEIKTTFGNLGAESKEQWVSMTNTFARETQSAYGNYLGKINEQAKEASDKLKEGAEELNRIVRNWDGEQFLKVPVETVLNNAKRDITIELKKLDQAVNERYPLMTTKIAEFNNHLVIMLDQVQSIQNVLSQWIQDAEKAQNKVHDIHETLVVADLLKNNFEQLKQANDLLTNIQGRMPGSNNGVQSEITESRRLLQDIREGIDKLANKKGFINRFWR